MTIQILPASEEDAEDLARMVVLCNADDKIFNHIVARARNATAAQKAEHIRWRSERNRWNMQKKGSYYFKAVDTLTKCSAGFAAIISPENEKSAWPGGPSETVDQEYFMEYVQAVERKKNELLGDADDIWHVPAMVVHPEYQGRGIGSKLLVEICALASKAGQRVYLESSPAGTKLYLNAGFEEIGKIEFLNGQYVLICMLWKADSAL